MFGEILRFELRYRLKQPILYLFTLFFFLMAFGAVSSDSVQVGGEVGNVARNAPYVIFNLLGTLGGIGLLVLTVFVTSAVNRDHEYHVQELFFSTPLSKSAYLAGRFAGSLIPSVLAVTVSALGIVLASQMPWQDPQRILPFSIQPYLMALAFLVIPNLFFGGALFFSVATLTRRVLLAWVTMVAFFTLWGVAQAFLGDLENEAMASLLDPFGLVPLRLVTKYWTVVEKNTALPPVGGSLLVNRLVWITVGLAVLFFTHHRYRMTLAEAGSATRRGNLARAPVDVPDQPAVPFPAAPLAVSRFDAAARFGQWWHLTRTELGGVFRGLSFIILMLLGVMNLAGSLVADIGGTHNYPVTRIMLRTIEGTFTIFLFLVLVLYGANLVWRERRARIHEVTDSLPIPSWIPLTAKLTTLAAVAAVSLFIAMLTAMAYQLSRGYTTLEPGLYLKGLFLVSLSEWILVAILALTVHVLTNNMHLGFLVMVIYFLALEILPGLGLEHRLYYFAKTPDVRYSDMNGYGPYRAPLVWFNVYWAFLATLLVLLSRLLWVRGTDSRFRFRVREALGRLTRGGSGRRYQVSLALSLAAFLVTGGWIYYNTNILNPYRTEKGRNQRLALYEKRYKAYEALPQPRLQGVQLQADIYPQDPRADLHGQLHLLNASDQPVRQLHMLLDPAVEIRSLGLPPHTLEVDDREVGYRIYGLRDSLPPGACLAVAFDLTVHPRGFVNSRPNIQVVENGTFFDNAEYLPRFGYDRYEELVAPNDRKKFKLAPRPRARPVDDPEGRRRMAFNEEWINCDITLSTSLDETAIAPGDLERTWDEGNRRYFHYKVDTPMTGFYSIQSGRYAVSRATWKDITVEVYCHPRHAYNVGRMIEAIEKSLDYYTSNYGPYDHHVIRIVEFPGYRTFAQSFPSTIPYSETAYFINDLRNKKNIDMVFFITAHEVAHQWWGNQIMPADVQGATFIIESLAQYSALMVMEKEYSREQMRKFLAYELDRYLKGRGNEKIGERPLMLVEDQEYIHYCKGGLALYALRDYVGEEALNGALRKFLQEKSFQQPLYANSVDLLAHLRAATPPEYQYLITDLFETITLYDNRAEAASVEKIADGKYRVKLVVQSHKYRADERGQETEVEHHDWIEVGILGADQPGVEPLNSFLYREKHRIPTGTSELEIVVDGPPVRAGIDPRNLLIDRVPGDNTKRVST